MDTGKGYFDQFETYEDLIKNHPDVDPTDGVFSEGEILEIKGSRFQISKVIRNGLKLRLLPKE